MALLKHDSKSIRTDLNWDFSSGTVTGIPSGSLVLIKTLTASASSSLSFVNGSNDVVLDSTYKAYKFVFKNIHSSNSTVNFTFQGSTNGGSSYGVTITSTIFTAYHGENDVSSGLVYVSDADLAQSTSYQPLSRNLQTANDDSVNGEIWLYNPSSTTYVKHFTVASVNSPDQNANMTNEFSAGYFNTTSAIDAIDFKMSSGNIDAGTISLYGLTT